MSTGPRDAPPEFLRALRSLRGVTLRPEVSLEEAPGPSRIAPYTAALVAEVRSSRRDPEADALATGRFVVLHDPAGQEAWEGAFRLVTLVRATLEPEVGQDPLLAEVAWSWFSDALASADVDAHAAGGTVTRVLSQSFGALDERPELCELELRASWTAREPDLAPHLRAWGVLLCTVAGLPPLPDGVVSLGLRH
ncbi:MULTISPECIES: DUF3000 domain-containing protein [unclassified Cellulomonas]|uniref:DUF3000 domain-containing protein n=1 Tax=unclassified Cellulomonas TaxID=2620175 RepID=UPI0019C5A64E|nr:DUF3000 domain-containing protein [Cellulomonas sp. ES6]MBD3778626.1 DUF3000 domain-containing protein [Micrococcales bacterium]WHP17677.1 DUF3000 domain-containing protein [Cellulomonas sp. ES6]